jgi:hypothetical protein
MNDIDAERNRLADILKEMAWERPPGGERMQLAIASSVVRRGRRLTATEQLNNLKKALQESDDEHA